MSAISDSPDRSLVHIPRVIGEYTAGQVGSTVVVIGGIHGNEPAGIFALHRVFQQLKEKKWPLKGRLIGVSGNRGALAKGKRFQGRDLNRKWYPASIQALSDNMDDSPVPEDHEQRELANLFEKLAQESQTPLIFLDIHSTSAKGAAFCGIADTLRNRKIAFPLEVPVVFGLEETIEGSMLGFLDDLGHITTAFEGGQHDDPETIDNAEAAIWQTLYTSGLLEQKMVPNHHEHLQRLKGLRGTFPQFVEIRYRHKITEDDGFKMNPGYHNFQKITQDECLAQDHTGKLYAEESGRILMPLYQPLGEDGYFVIRDISYFWLAFSALLRHFRLDRLVPFFPGVRPHPDKPEHYIANTRIARFFVKETFHLLGFRRREQMEDGSYLFSRRRPDF